MGRFEELLTGVMDDLKVLPLIHTCDGYGFRSILESGIIESSLCPVFNKDFVYAFYGKPSYKIAMEGSSKNVVNFPVCFIMSQSYLPSFSRMYPFDSGAFEKIDDIKSSYFHKSMNISDFQVSPNIANAVKIVKKFYLNNRKYVDDDPGADLEAFKPSEFEARGYAELIKSRSVARFDDRVSTIEIVYDKSIQLNKWNLMQVIIPNGWTAQDDTIFELLAKKYGVTEPIIYYAGRGNPLVCHGAINQKYREYVEDGGLL